MWEIQKTTRGTWRITTEAAIQPGGYDATGEYTSKQGAIEAATLHGDSYIIIPGVTE